ncbi:Putative ribonuclease H protein At1g65750, partial [Linum perenne]
NEPPAGGADSGSATYQAPSSPAKIVSAVGAASRSANHQFLSSPAKIVKMAKTADTEGLVGRGVTQHDVNTMKVWIRLPGLPLENFDAGILRIIGDRIGRTVRVDGTTLFGNRGNYARVCVEIDLREPLVSKYRLHRRVRRIEYEGLHEICFHCGRYGHEQERCPSIRPPSSDQDKPGENVFENPIFQETEFRPEIEEEFGPWMKAKKNMRRRQLNKKETKLPKQRSDEGEAVMSKSKFEVLVEEEVESDEGTGVSGTKADHQGGGAPEGEHPREPAATFNDKVVPDEVVTPEGAQGPSLGTQQPAAVSHKLTPKSGKDSAHYGKHPSDNDKRCDLPRSDGTSHNGDLPRSAKDARLLKLHFGTGREPHGQANHGSKEKEVRGSSTTQGRMGNESKLGKCGGSEKFMLTAIYGKPNIRERNLLWDAIKRLSANVVEPWILSGDFNALLSMEDKRGGAPFNVAAHRPFVECVNICGLTDTRTFGPRFTWHRGATSERLDRALTNDVWLLRFPHTRVRHLHRVYSDHHPILVCCEDIDRARVVRPFRFLAPWLVHDNFRDVLQASWRVDSEIPVKLLHLSSKLKKWNKETFGDVFKRKKALVLQLEQIEHQRSANHSEMLLVEEGRIRAELERTLAEEEIIWIQKSRCKNVLEGDRNTSYYHKATLRRRAFNKIRRLRSSDGTQDLGRYLGVPLIHGRNLTRLYQFLVECIGKKLDGWKTGSLSFAGRVSLALSALNTIPAYTMQIALLPNEICNAIDQKIRSFIWGSYHGERKLHLLNWDTVCQPKDCGGLGIRSAKEMNLAFLMKLTWGMIKEPGTVWASVLRTKYLKQSTTGLIPKKSKRRSSIWKGMNESWSIFTGGLSWSIRNGRKTNFWRERWLDDGTIIGDLVQTPPGQEEAVIADFCDQSGAWDVDSLARMLPANVLRSVVGMTPPCPDLEDDAPVWGLEPHGSYSVKSGYLLAKEMGEGVHNAIWKRVWSWKGPQRVRQFLWVAIHKRLMTNVERRRRHITNNAECGLCVNEEESMDHILRGCTLSRQVWCSTLSISTADDFFSINLDEWWKKFISDKKLSLVFGITCWLLWKVRNERVFEGKMTTVAGIVAQGRFWIQTTNDAYTSLADLKLGKEQRRVQKDISWTAAPWPACTLNTDGSVIASERTAAAGGCLRDTNGRVLDTFAANLGNCSITRAELTGVAIGLERAWGMGFRRVEVQTDSACAVKMLSDSTPAIHQHATLISKIRSILHRPWSVSVKFIYREGNHLADFLANKGHDLAAGTHTLDSSERGILHWVNYDLVGSCEARWVLI